MMYILVLILGIIVGWFLATLHEIQDYNVIPKPKFKYLNLVKPKFLENSQKKYKVVDSMWNDKYHWYVYYIVNVNDEFDVYPDIQEEDLELFTENEEDKNETESNSVKLS